MSRLAEVIGNAVDRAMSVKARRIFCGLAQAVSGRQPNQYRAKLDKAASFGSSALISSRALARVGMSRTP